MPPLKRVPPGPTTKYDALMVAIQLHESVNKEKDPAERQRKLGSRDACFEAWRQCRWYRFVRISDLRDPQLERQRVIRFLTSKAETDDLPSEYLEAIDQALSELGHLAKAADN